MACKLMYFPNNYTQNYTFSRLKLVVAKVLKINLLNQPNYYNVKILPQDIKDEISKELMDWYDEHKDDYKGTRSDTPNKVHKIPGLVSYMNSADWGHLAPQFKQYTQWFDAKRNEDFVSVAPRLKDWYESI